VTDYVDDLAHVVGSFPDPVVLYGHSLGAMVAAAVAGRLPDKVRAIVLEDPPFHTMGDRIGETTFLELFAALRSIHDRLTAPPHDETEPARITRLTAELSQARVGGQRLGDLRELPLLRFTVRCLSAMDPAVLDPILQRRWLTGYDPPEVAASVRCPVLLFQADSAVGGMLSADDAAMFCRLAPQTLLVPAPGRGHLIHNTSADFMLRYLVPFLESV
jgi:pimeloyl-ACP methyl ester carboxylesterase